MANGFAPDLLLRVVMMTEMDGATRLPRLRASPQMMPALGIFIAATLQHSKVAYYKWLGALGVIAQPFDQMQLAQQVQQ